MPLSSWCPSGFSVSVWGKGWVGWRVSDGAHQKSEHWHQPEQVHEQPLNSAFLKAKR